MAISTPLHLLDQLLVPVVKSSQLSYPAPGFGVKAVAALLEHENIPQAVQLTVLAEQVAAA
jgi:hypothetical protein